MQNAQFEARQANFSKFQYLPERTVRSTIFQLRDWKFGTFLSGIPPLDFLLIFRSICEPCEEPLASSLNVVRKRGGDGREE